jgi:dGTPase
MNWEKLMCAERIRPSSTGAPCDRSDFLRDYDRIIFSKPFRRLQKKTQVFPLPDHDFIHTRLTHSLETSCVGRSLGMAAGKAILGKYPQLNDANISAYDFAAVVAAASVAHDIGNPPFGHSGEAAICDFFRGEKGKLLINDLSENQRNDLLNFEGNAMGFRLMAYTLPKVSQNEGGLNLTYATLGAFTKYPCEFMPIKPDGASSKKYGYFQSQKARFNNIAENLSMMKKVNSSGAAAYYRHPLAFLVEAADDISYLLMDYEDGFNLKIVTFDEIKDAFRSLIAKTKTDIDAILLKTYDEREKVAFLRSLAINSLIGQCVEVFTDKLDRILNGKYDIALSDEIPKAKELIELKQNCRKKVYKYRKVLEIESAGFEVIGGLLSEFLDALKGSTEKAKKIRELISPHYVQDEYKTPDQWYEAILNIVQFIAGMTDTFAIDTFRTIKGIRVPNY